MYVVYSDMPPNMKLWSWIRGELFMILIKSENIEMKPQEDLVTSESTWRMENKPRKTQRKEIQTACQWQVLNEKSE